MAARSAHHATFVIERKFEFVPNERIISTYDMRMDETRISVSLATVEFKLAAKAAYDLHRADRVPRRIRQRRLARGRHARSWTIWMRN